jgi:hypothetical protein
VDKGDFPVPLITPSERHEFIPAASRGVFFKGFDKNEDENQIAHRIVSQATGKEEEKKPDKNPAAVSLGRLGGLKGGKARAEKLSPKRRIDIARKAAKARWTFRKRG